MPHMSNMPWINIYTFILCIFFFMIFFNSQMSKSYNSMKLFNQMKTKKWMW